MKFRQGKDSAEEVRGGHRDGGSSLLRKSAGIYPSQIGLVLFIVPSEVHWSFELNCWGNWVS